MSLKRPRSDEEVVIGVVDIVGTVQELRGKVARLEQELRDCNVRTSPMAPGCIMGHIMRPLPVNNP